MRKDSESDSALPNAPTYIGETSAQGIIFPSDKGIPDPSHTSYRRRAGRKPKPIDRETVFELAAIQCTVDEIAAVLRTCRQTLYSRFKDEMECGWIAGRQSLRRKQFQLAMRGNPIMLIWLGKQYLGQTDKYQPKEPDGRLSEEQLKGLYIEIESLITRRDSRHAHAVQATRETLAEPIASPIEVLNAERSPEPK